MEERKLKFAVLGTGFWANYQIPAWQELDGVELVAVYNRTRAKAAQIANRFDVPRVYDDAQALLDAEELDFVDIITDVDTHPHFTELAARRGVHVICQKPMAASLTQAQGMLSLCQQQGVQLYIHENFRWQAPLRALKRALAAGTIGAPFKARVSFCSAFPVFENQPFLAELDKFILTDVGSHVLDVCRFLFGEARSLYCLTKRVNPKIQGEDVANVLMEMESGLHCYAEMSYASILEKESFPQTLVLVEGERGSLHLTHDFELKITKKSGTESEVVEPVMYPWLDPDYAVVHSSIVDCNRDILRGLQGGTSEMTGADNFRTVQLVWASYESAATGQVMRWK
ncbi:Gfo/Idh/MocA family oxidoreductase [Rhabdobacter roseus]|uniref:Putative dehydrogenase n=1 Tax=Rhabdobacter roseus TaxID=1655419 RepID=A0A840U2H4_9BACT|nr:Gfo/Idh/MocA family oxidoreductase [Rhabdobacter roseus]MBB5286558.1 putative dehydrogenase [Rhabdobacter roseus]